MPTWEATDSETSGPIVRITFRISRNGPRRSPIAFARGSGDATSQRSTPSATGTIANQRYGVRQVPVVVARYAARSGAAKNERWPPVMWKPIAAPRTRGEKSRAMRAAAGAWVGARDDP